MNALTTTTRSVPSMLMDPSGFDQLYRVGKMLASSVLFPEHLRKGTPEQAAANGALVMNMAIRLNEDPLTVAQQIYFVGGKPGWSTSYLIAKANQHGVFSNPIDWEIKGKGDSLAVTAFADLSGTGKRVQFTCDMDMAKAEGWVKNPKYRSMPELMLRYRSAAALIRLYVPDIMVGVPAQIEVELGGEMRDITPREFSHAAPAEKEEPTDAVVEDGDEDKPEPESDHDPETGEVKEDAAAEKEFEEKAIAAAKANKADNDARQDLQDKRDASPAKPKNTPDSEQFRGLFDMIKRDLLDAGSVDDVIDLYADQIEQMRENAPDLHAELQAEFEAFRKEQA